MRKLIAALVVLAFVLPAVAGIDVVVGNGDKVTGTLSPSSETDIYRVACPAGATLSVVAKGLKKNGGPAAPAVRIHVFGPAGPEVGVPVPSATGSKLTGLKLTATGAYRVEVTSGNGGVGDYQLQIIWKSPTKATPLAADSSLGDAHLVFSASQGTVATFSVSTPKGSNAQPFVKNVSGVDFFAAPAVPAPGTKKYRVSVTLGETANFDTTLSDQGAGGPYKVALTLKAPKPAARKLVLTDTSLGGGAVFVMSTIAGPDGGAITAPNDGSSLISGASVLVPPGALSAPSSIVLGPSTPIAPAVGTTSAGPAIFFGPEGLKFATSATIRIPFDPALVEEGSLQVFTRDAKGKVTKVTAPLTIDPVGGFISFPSSHFSSYEAFGKKAPALHDLNADGIDDLVIPAAGDASRRGAVFVFFGGEDIAGGSTTTADVALTGEAAGDYFGASVSTGDVNGDGRADLVVGAPKAGGTGKVYVFFGGSGFASRSASAADAALTTQSGDAGFGQTVVVAQATGDTKLDVLVGAPASSFGQSIEGGRAYVFPGATPFTSTASNGAGVVQLDGSSAYDHFGLSIAVGDITADGIPDVAVGSDQAVVQNTGIVHVFSGATLQSQQASGSVLHFTGVQSLDLFGTAVAIGDVNGDGTGDLAVGAPGYDDPNDQLKHDIGAVFVFYGDSKIGSNTAAGAGATILNSEAGGDGAGQSIVIGNFLGNAVPDLFFGVPGSDFNQINVGEVQLARGGPDFFSGAQIIVELLQNAAFGSLLLQPADVNGDGHLDAIAAAPGHNVTAGRVHVFLGPGLFGRSIDVDGTPGQQLGIR